MNKITKVPNGPLIKKKGPFKGSTLKSGGTIKKAQAGKRVPVKSVSTLTAPKGTTVDMKPTSRDLTSSDMTRLTSVPKTKKERSNAVSLMSYNNYVKNPKQGFQKPGLSFDDWMGAERERTMKNARNNPEPKEERGFFGGGGGAKSPCKGGKCSGLNSSSRNGSTIKKAKSGASTTTTKTTNPIGIKFFKEGKNYKAQVTKKVGDKNATYEGISPNMDFAKVLANDKALTRPADSLRTRKNGGMLKRADGSYSKRGLWDNIRANKGSGKKPTKQMLVQEKKIKAKSKK